jgi:hypothetical protein
MVKDQEYSFKWFVLISFSIAWVSFANAVLYAYFDKNVATMVFLIIGGLGPIIAFLSLMLTYRNSEYNRNFWKRVYYPKIGPLWLVLSAVLLPIVVNFLPVLFSIGSRPVFTLGTYLSGDGIFLLFALVGVLGWYGYAYPILKNRLENPIEFKIRSFENPEKKKKERRKKFKDFIGRVDHFIESLVLTGQNILKKSPWVFSGLIIGVLMSIWYIPIAFIIGTNYYDFGLNFGFWEFLILIPIQSVIISWGYSKTKMSTFLVLIFFLADITFLFFSISKIFQIIRIVLWFSIMVIIILNEHIFHIVNLSE